MLFARVGVDIRLEPLAGCIANFAACACCAFRFDAEVLVGGGVCIEPAERIDVSVSWPEPIFNGVDASFKERWEPFLFGEEDEGSGDEDNWRDGSTGGNDRGGFGAGCLT